MGGINELARMMKERENKPYPGPQLGIVEAAPPDIKVRLGDVILLDKEDLLVAAHLLSFETVGYQEDDKSGILQSDMPGTNSDSGNNVGTVTFYDGTVSGESKTIMDISITRGAQLTGYFTLQPGDEVILIPTGDGQTFFLMDKAVRL